MSNVFQEDAAQVASNQCIDWDVFDGSTFVVSGATGLIGRNLIAALLARGSVGVVALSRDVSNAKTLLSESERLSFLSWDAMGDGGVLNEVESVDFLVHGASATASKFFVEHPFETIGTTISGTRQMLELSGRTGARMLYLSSMEAYGDLFDERPLAEDTNGEIDTSSVRSCYPESKRIAECMCAAYASEYGAWVASARLAQTFGAGVASSDGRAFAEFARLALSGRDIRIATDGSKRNSKLYTADAVSGILTVLSRGASGEVYNIANSDTFSSIAEMAELVASRYGKGSSKVVLNADHKAAAKYPRSGVLNLDVSKLEAIGWKARYGLSEMFDRMIGDWQE